MHHELLTQALVFLLATVVAVPVFNRLKLGPVVAYLVAGALLGPHAFRVIVDGEAGMAAGELGVVLLLFLIGLELSPARLWLMRRAVFAVGALQVAATVFVLGIAIAALGQTWQVALVAGIALALSSTAIGVQLMAERKELAQSYGRTALAVLLFQDMAAIPAIGILPLLGAAAAAPGPNVGDTMIGILKVLGVIASVVVAGHFLIRPLFRYIAQTKSLEAFTAATLLIALGTAWVTSLVGLSMALGSFLAGILLAESEFRHEIEAHIEPFKGLLLGLFFLGVGLTVDWSYVGAHALDVAFGVVGLLAAKSILLYVIGRRAANLGHADSLRLAAVLSQGGEFAFVLLALASDGGLVGRDIRDLLTAVVVVSMAATPLLVLGLDRHLAKAKPKPIRPYDTIPEDDDTPRVIIAGFGRVGQIVARVLRAQRIAFTALEHSVEQVDVSRRFGNKIYYGDPSRPDLLRAARCDQAEIFVVATDDPEANLRTARLVKHTYPHLKVFARARNRQHAFRLMELELDGIVRETLHSSLVLSKHVLEALGVAPAQADDRIKRFLAHDQKVLVAQQAIRDDEAKLIQSSQEALQELEQLFEADLKS